MSEDRRQRDRRQGTDRRDSTRKINMSTFIVILVALIVIFTTIITIVTINYQRKIDTILNIQDTIDEEEPLSLDDSEIILENLTIEE